MAGGGGAGESSLIPLRRNLLCFFVCSLVAWIFKSHSLHKIALSSWQKTNPFLSYKHWIKPSASSYINSLIHKMYYCLTKYTS
jgi:hypothetical protein